ncbi:hypothetical protein [Mesorhizobium erdmanii]|uniref:hypothetical protein n=1 Tax=Mesorhizobium erdmanii TaxID=1777866 RepID=UPI0012B6552F|nr:hypothetical protein [Mesorhizobium erdmanii]
MVMFSDPQLREVAEGNGMTTDQKVLFLVQSGHLGPTVLPGKLSSAVAARPHPILVILASILSSVTWRLRSMRQRPGHGI